MKKYNVAIAILMSLGLVACGSGGGGSSSTTTEPQTATTTPSEISAENITFNGQEYTHNEAGQLVPKTEDAQPTESTATTEQTQPAETAQPVEQPPQATATETAQSSEQPQPTTEATQPTEPPAPTEEVVNTPPKLATSLDNVPEELKEAVREAKKIDLSNEAGEITRSFYVSDRPEGVLHEKLNSKQVIRGINQTYSSSTSIYDGNSRFWSNEVDLTFTKQARDSGLEALFTKEADLPKGVVSYQGKSVGPDYEGNLSLTANFDEKTVQGKITDRNGTWNRGDVQLELTTMHKLSDSDTTAFTGKTSGRGFEQNYYFGAFAGPHAEEVVGELFKTVEDTSEGAAEGAKKIVTYENFGGKKVE